MIRPVGDWFLVRPLKPGQTEFKGAFLNSTMQGDVGVIESVPYGWNAVSPLEEGVRVLFDLGAARGCGPGNDHLKLVRFNDIRGVIEEATDGN